MSERDKKIRTARMGALKAHLLSSPDAGDVASLSRSYGLTEADVSLALKERDWINGKLSNSR